jgi:hypothetical protein
VLGFRLRQAAYSASNNSGDPEWANVLSLLHCDTFPVVDERGNTVSTPTGNVGLAGLGFSIPGFGNSYQFDAGSINISLPASTTFGTGDFTIEQWVKMTYPTSGNQYLLFSAVVDGLPVLDVLVEDNGQVSLDGDLGAVNTGATIPEDVWSWVVVRRASGLLEVYIDGFSGPGTITNYGVLCDGSGTLEFILGDTSGPSYVGLLDEFRVSNVDRGVTAPSTPFLGA